MSAVVREREVYVVTVGEPGPRGAPGADGTGGATLHKRAGEAMSAFRVVVSSGDEEVLLASNTVAAHATKVLGITEASASNGSDVSVRRFGPLTSATWSWTPDQLLFVGVNGQLTHTPPSAPAVFSQAVAVAVSETSIYIWPREAVGII